MKAKFIECWHMLSRVPSLLFALFSISVVAMNLLANKAVDTGIEWLVMDSGILFSWFVFMCMDVMTRCYGPKVATVASFAALGIELLCAFMFFLAASLPGAWGESFTPEGGDIINAALNHTFGGTWFIILGSSIAYAVSAIVNNTLNWAIGERLKNKQSFSSFAMRSYVSTCLAQYVDNFTFALIVSHLFFGWTVFQCATSAAIGALLELSFEIIFSPMGYQLSQHILKDQAKQQQIAVGSVA